MRPAGHRSTHGQRAELARRSQSNQDGLGHVGDVASPRSAPPAASPQLRVSNRLTQRLVTAPTFSGSVSDFRWAPHVAAQRRTKRKKRSGKRYVEGKEYSGDKNKDSVEANILKILGITWNQKKFIEHISGRRIYSTSEYVKYRDENTELSLPDHPRRKWSDFCWGKTLNICDKGKFYTRQECIEKIGELLEEFDEL